MGELARNQTEAVRFVNQIESLFGTRKNGMSWPNHDVTELNGKSYVRALLRPSCGKTCTDIASSMNLDQESIERFVRDSPWEYDAVEDHLHQSVPEEVQGKDAVHIVDGMAIPKSGKDSVGAARQWCGVDGKVDLCQVTVNSVITRPGEEYNANQVTFPLSMQLYLPDTWTGEPDAYDSQAERQAYEHRRKKTEVPDVPHEKKWEMALSQIVMASDHLEFGCVGADIGFGRVTEFRRQLRAMNQPYALEVETGKFPTIPRETELEEPGPTPGKGAPRKHPRYPEDVEAQTPEEIAETLSGDDWTEVTWNQGSDEKMTAEFYRTQIRTVTDRINNYVSDETGWLLLKRSPEDSADEADSDHPDHADGEHEQEELKAWICWGVDDEPLDQLVTWSQIRWAIERFHQDSKQHLGADEYQGRTWKGFHHHLAAVMLAHQFLAKQRLKSGVDQDELPSFESVVHRIVKEEAIQRLMRNHGLERETAKEIGVDMLTGFTEWKPSSE